MSIVDSAPLAKGLADVKNPLQMRKKGDFMAFSERVKPLWDKSNLTLAQLAERCNISESSASRYLSGKINPPADIAEKILEVLGGASPVEGEKEMQTVVQHIREIYEAQIAAMQVAHDSRVEDLRRDKSWMFRVIIVLFGVIVYLCVDGLHGNWGLFQYPVV